MRWDHDQHVAAAVVAAPRRLLRRRGRTRTDNIGGNRVQAITERRLDRPSMNDVPIAAAASRDRLRRHLQRINKFIKFYLRHMQKMSDLVSETSFNIEKERRKYRRLDTSRDLAQLFALIHTRKKRRADY